MFGLGVGELLLIFLIALIFIGPKKLPELAKGLGKGLREFQNATKGISDQLNEAKREITRGIDEVKQDLPGPNDFPMHGDHSSDAPSETLIADAEVVPHPDTKPKDPV